MNLPRNICESSNPDHNCGKESNHATNIQTESAKETPLKDIKHALDYENSTTEENGMYETPKGAADYTTLDENSSYHALKQHEPSQYAALHNYYSIKAPTNRMTSNYAALDKDTSYNAKIENELSPYTSLRETKDKHLEMKIKSEEYEIEESHDEEISYLLLPEL